MSHIRQGILFKILYNLYTVIMVFLYIDGKMAKIKKLL